MHVLSAYVCPPSPLSSQDEKKREQKMAAPALLVREGVAMGINVSVVNLVDRRDAGSTELQEWTFQREVEAVLYANGFSQQTGAIYRLLQRSGAGGCSLPLKKASIQQGIVTHEEFEWMHNHLRDVRSFTLIPVDALRVALSVFGQNERSEALMPSYLWITYGLFCRDRLTCTRAKPCSIARIGHLHADAVAAHRKLRFPCALSIVEKGYRHVSTLISPVA